MEIKTVWSVYFSATGTTEKVVTTLAKTVAQELGAQYQTFSFNLPKSREDELTFGPDDLVVMGVPVYAGRVPNLLLPCEPNSFMYESCPSASMPRSGGGTRPILPGASRNPPSTPLTPA